MPALATKTSILPKSWTTCCIAFSTASGSVTVEDEYCGKKKVNLLSLLFTLYALVLTLCSFASVSARLRAASLLYYVNIKV
jgi:hypothetical protein